VWHFGDCKCPELGARSVFTHSQISAYNSSVVNIISTKLKLVGRNNGF